MKNDDDENCLTEFVNGEQKFFRK
ncbi:hypothetical protein Mgra_00000382 [Meloidogyne graminicola]|uniref:Uncharacterized protein n=1 Tax=Meloidogyne graminicola TaxID=189291 RepID=A0A8T0A1J0_9BILA|nr:hypothetical protein Mgra_00000382 [Meloidogyne graminicola]